MFLDDLRVFFETPDLLPDTFNISSGNITLDHRDHPLTDHVLKFLDIASLPPAESPFGASPIYLVQKTRFLHCGTKYPEMRNHWSDFT